MIHAVVAWRMLMLTRIWRQIRLVSSNSSSQRNVKVRKSVCRCSLLFQSSVWYGLFIPLRAMQHVEYCANDWPHSAGVTVNVNFSPLTCKVGNFIFDLRSQHCYTNLLFCAANSYVQPTIYFCRRQHLQFFSLNLCAFVRKSRYLFDYTTSIYWREF